MSQHVSNPQSHISKTSVQTKSGELRLNKFLSDAGICSRREADRLIEAGKVLIDGKLAVLGDKVTDSQLVTVNGQEVRRNDELILLALNKPEGIECTTDASNPDNIVDFIGYPKRVYPIGRLDKNSTGLILLTNTGELVDQILRSSNLHEKEYVVTVDHKISPDFLKQMSEGVEIYIDNEDRTVTTRKCKTEQIDELSFSVILTQGFNRQIRRMCKALGYRVTSLKRIRVMNIRLGDLKEGCWREVTEEEIKELLSALKESQTDC